MHLAVRTIAAVCVALSSAGCVAAALYDTPETLAPGQIEIAGAPEAWRVQQRLGPTADHAFPGRTEEERGWAAIPTAVVRIGLLDGLDVGLGTVRADAKIRLWSGAGLRVALDPIVRVVRTQDGLGAVVELPLLVGLRLGRHVTVVVNGGLGGLYLATPDEEADGRGGTSKEYESFAAGRLGGGLRIRLSELVAIQPEVAYVRALSSPSRRLDWLSGGVAVVFGRAP